MYKKILIGVPVGITLATILFFGPIVIREYKSIHQSQNPYEQSFGSLNFFLGCDGNVYPSEAACYKATLQKKYTGVLGCDRKIFLIERVLKAKETF